MLALLVVASTLGPSLERTLNVFAAASLKEAFTTLGKRYEASHPGLKVRFSFAGSQTLASQISHGAPADVFASASVKNLNDTFYDKSSLRIFALNRLTIAVRKNLAGIRSVADLTKVRKLVIADPAVPVGRYTEAFFIKASATLGSTWLKTVRSRVVSREQDVKAVLTKVKLGEADAGIVYISDVRAAKGDVRAVAIPDRFNQTAQYPAAIPTPARNKDDAKLFIKFLLDRDSQRTLEQSGFVPITRPVKLRKASAGSARGYPFRGEI